MMEREPDLRRHPRARVAWPVTVEAGERHYRLETVNLSPFGAKLRVEDSPLTPGTKVHLHFEPPDRGGLRVQAIVWRTDPDGLASFFVGIDDHFSFPVDAAPD